MQKVSFMYWAVFFLKSSLCYSCEDEKFKIILMKNSST